MTARKLFVLSCVVALSMFATSPLAAEQMPAAGETAAEVPALTACHEVIYPLWHEAWPSKDFAAMRELLPQIQGHVAALKAAELPGILRDKKAAWDTGVTAFAAAAGQLEAALGANQEQAALDAAEELHARFEQLVRVIRPAMKELDAYHVVLYDVYHKIMPVKDLSKLPAAADELVSRCAALQAAAVHKRFAAKESALKESFAALCAATAELKAAASDEAKAAAAVERVHTAYQATERLFE